MSNLYFNRTMFNSEQNKNEIRRDLTNLTDYYIKNLFDITSYPNSTNTDTLDQSGEQHLYNFICDYYGSFAAIIFNNSYIDPKTKQNFVDYLSKYLPSCINVNNERMVSRGGRKKKRRTKKKRYTH